MKSVNGFYDGQSVRFLEHTPILKNQRLIITVMDEFVDDKPVKDNVNNSKREAFLRLEKWRRENEESLNFDWKKEVEEAIDEKYGIIDNDKQ